MPLTIPRTGERFSLAWHEQGVLMQAAIKVDGAVSHYDFIVPTGMLLGDGSLRMFRDVRRLVFDNLRAFGGRGTFRVLA